MQLNSRGHRAHATPVLCHHIEARPSRFGPREAGWDLYGPRVESDRRKGEVKSWVRLHHLELMKSYGRSVARSIAKSKATGTSRVTAHLVTGYS